MKHLYQLTTRLVSLFALIFLFAINTWAQTETEGNNDFESANLIPFTGEATGSVCPNGDADFFKVIVPRDGVVRVHMEVNNTGTSAGTLHVSGYDQRRGNGNLFNNVPANYTDPGVVKSDDADVYCRSLGDTLYFAVWQDYQCFNYKLTFTMVGLPTGNDVEPNNSFLQAIKFNIADTVKGHLGYVSGAGVTDDVDFYKTVLPADGKYRIYMEATNTGSSSGIFSVNGYDQRKDNGSLFSATPAYYSDPQVNRVDSVDLFCRSAGDTIYFRLSQAYQCFSYKITYKMIGSPSDNDVEPNNTFQQATTFGMGDTAKGHIGYVAAGGVTDEVDFFKTVLPNDGKYRIYMEATNTGNSSGVLSVSGYDQRKDNGNLFNATPAYYTDPNTTRLDSVDLFCRSAGDTLYFRISQAYQCFNYKITYKMIGSPTDNDTEPNNSFEQATRFNMGDTAKGHIGYVAAGGVTDEVDFYKTIIPKDGVVRLYMEAGNTGNSSGVLNVSGYDQRKDNGNLFNVTPAYYTDANTTRLDSVDIYGHAAGDTFYFRVSQSYQCFNYKLSYKIITPSVDNDIEPNNTFGQSATFNVKDTVQGHIAYSNGSVTDLDDYYKSLLPFEGTIKVHVEATNTGNGSGLLYMSLYDSKQNNISNRTVAYYSNAGSTVYDSFTVSCRSIDTTFFRMYSGSQSFTYKFSYEVLSTSNGISDTEPNNSFNEATLINMGDTVHGNIGHGFGGGSDDVDYFKTKVPYKGTMQVFLEATNTGDGGSGLFYITGYDKNGNVIFSRNPAYYTISGQISVDNFNLYCRDADTFYFKIERSGQCFSYKLRYQVTLGPDTTVYTCSGCTTNISKLYDVAPFSSVTYEDMSSPGTTVNPESVGGGTYMLSVFNGTDECSRDTAIITVSTGQIVIFDSIPDKTYGDAPFTVKARSSAGLSPVTYKIVSGPATINGNVVTVTGVGSVTIRAEQAGNSSYNYALADRTFNVKKAAASVTLSDLNKVYNGNAATPSAVTNPPSLPVSFTFDGNATAPINAGTYQVIATINSENFKGTTTGTFAIQKASQTISLTPVSDKEYTNQPFTVNAAATSGLPVSFSISSDPAGIASLNNNSITLTGLGKVFITASQAGNQNFLSAQQVLDTFIVNKGNQSISFDAITDKEFDAAPFNVNASASSGLPITYSISTVPATGVASISGNTITLLGNAGTVTATASQAGNELYNQAQQQQTFKVLPGTPDLTVQTVTTQTTTLVPGDTIGVAWNVANVGKAASPGSWNERIYLQSADGQNRTFITQVAYTTNDSLRKGQTLQRSEKIAIPARLNVGDQGVFVVELVPGSTVNETPGTQANNIAVQQTALTVKKSLTIELSATQITEGSTDGISAQVSRTGSLSDPLTVNLAVTNAARFSMPSTITIPAGQSAQIFTVTAINNNAIEGTITDSISALATSFSSTKAYISILDDDKPTLTITQLPADAMEGQTVTFKVNTDLTLTQPLTVFITSNNQARFPVPASVTIPAGSNSADVTVKLDQDQIPEIDVLVNIIAGAANHNSANATIQVKDDDIPGLELVVETNMISEAAGYYATKATLRRTNTSNPIAFTANLSANITNALILPATVSLAKDENEKTFNIGVIDNSQVDGNRSVSITASIFVNSCGCSAPSTSSGSVTAAITVTDNDGPALQITANPLTLAEGLANAGSIRITRNTATASSLTVALTSSDVTEATVPAKVTILAGQSFIDVPVTTINDSVTDGNQQVYFQASATGYSTGSVWVIVSDQNKPDLQIPIVKLPNNSVQAMSVFNYQFGVKNTGFATAPAGVIVRGYLSLDNIIDESDSLISEDIISDPISAGETKQILNALKIPNLPGQYKVLYWVNPNLNLTELLTTNNTSVPTDLNIKPDYTATAVVDKNYYLKGTAIPVTGVAVRSDGSAAANEKVEVYIIVNGLRRTLSAITDATGHYTAQFVALANEAGHYSVGASYPGIGATAEQDNFDILGVRINGGEVPQFKVILKDTIKGTLPIVNLSNTSLTNFSLVPVNLPNGATIRFDTIPSFAGNATINLAYTITGSGLSSGNNFEVAGFKASAQEGTIQATNLYYYCQAPNAYIESTISTINVTASQTAGERTVEFKLVNKGMGSTGDVTINLPQINWLNSVTPKTLPSMAAGDTAVVVLKFLALAELPFDYPINGNIGITAQNGNSVSIPFTFEKVSESVGSVKVIATDQFTYYSAAAPKVANAHVVIKNYYTGQVYADGYTDSSGVLTATGIPEGKHRIAVEKDQHQPYSGTITINPGQTVETTAFLNYQAITFNWSVVPTAIQDQYDVTLETKFETNVPVPVVTIDMPKTMPELSGTETYAFNATLTNHGLITANEVKLGLPTGDPEYEFVTNYVPADLAAQQSIEVPVIMRRRTQPPAGGRSSVASISRYLGMQPAAYKSAESAGTNCQDFTSVSYWYKCNFSTGLWEKGGTVFSYSGRSCSGGPTSAYTGIPVDVGGIPTSDDGGYNDVPCATCGPGGKLAAFVNPLPPSQNDKKNCVQCINDIAGALAACTGTGAVGAAAGSLSCVSGNLMNDSAKLVDYIPCIPFPIPPPIGCLIGVNGALGSCASSAGVGGRFAFARSAKTAGKSPLGAAFDKITVNLKLVEDVFRQREEWSKEYFGNMAFSDAFEHLSALIETRILNLDSIASPAQDSIVANMTGYEIQAETIKAFFTRWNTSLAARKSGIMEPNAQYPDIINWNKVKVYSDYVKNGQQQSTDAGFASIWDMYEKEYKNLKELVDQQKNAVCASVSMQLSQRLTMTREAFEGTLEIFNGHPTDKMDSLSVNIKITDQNGVPSNDLFEIQTKSLTNLADITGTGAIAAQQKGGVKFLFIPENGAAPTAPKLYNFAGSVTYWDPYAQGMVTMPLSAVQLTVNPSPNLMLHYFMERNILGDDALTSPDIEPSVSAELAVMVENHGYGPAVNMMISSAQPKIVENEKGLAINFNLVGSNFQGQPKKLGVTDINFGTIPALETRIGQWYFTSSLLGKFVSYDAKVVHSNSFGNPALSLVNGVKLHELTKSIREYGQSDDQINDFLVNDIFDIHDEPDMIYFSQGNRTAKVYMAASGSFSAPVTPPSFTNKLTVTASNTGWNYIKLDDPGNKLYEIASVTRNDGQVIPLNNAWLTFVTLPVGKAPVYENKFHFVDTFPSTDAVTYTVVWKPKNLDVPKVDTITGIPKDITSSQVQNLKVVFNKRIDPATFTYEDLTLTFQGGQNIMNNSVVFTQIDTATFNVDLTSLTTGNGFYNLTVQAANVSDVYGINGAVGKQTSWTQMLNVPVVQAFQGIPDSRIAASYDKINLLFNLPIDVNTVTTARFTVKKDSIVQAGTLTIDSVRADHKLFYLSGLKNMLTQNGAYELIVDLPNIKSESQAFGVEAQSVILTVDNTGPIVSLEKSKTGGLDPQHIPYVNIRFNEDVAGFNTSSLKLTRNGEVLPLTYDQLSNTDLKTWMAGNFGMLTYPDGNYTFSIDMSTVKDAIGNSGTGTREISWVVDKTSTIEITNLGITPDRGYADKDGVTSGLSMNVTLHLGSAASEVTVYQSDLAGQKTLATVDNVAAGDLSIPVVFTSGGNTGIKVTAIGAIGGVGTAEKVLVIDPVPLTGQWKFEKSQTITRQVDSMQIALSAKILSDQGFLNAVKLSRNGTVLSTGGLSFKAVNDTVYEVNGLRNTSTLPGSYELNLDLQQFSKYSSGIAGNAPVSVLWTVQSTNRAPVAKAGSDTTITKTGVVNLDGSTSYDPDSDAITYRWVAPDGMTLTDSTSGQPSFTVTASNQGNTYPFLLIVNDGSIFTTDIVNVKVDLAPGEILPVTGLYLKAQQQGKDALLTWTTASDANTKSFVIERSLDGRTFNEIGTTPSKGGSQAGNYNYTDPGAISLQTGLLYYRLRRINNDGSVTYSAVVTIAVNQANDRNVIVKAYPNPFVQKITLQISNVASTSEADHVALYSLDGKKLYSQKLVIRGNTTIQLNGLPNLAQGTYLLLTSIDGKLYTTKVIKN